MRVLGLRNSSYALWHTKTYKPTHISSKISIEHLSVGLASLAQLEPMDLAVNKPLKHVMKMKTGFIAWYSDQVRTQLDRGIKIEEVKVDMRLSVVKSLSAKWIIKAVDEVASRP